MEEKQIDAVVVKQLANAKYAKLVEIARREEAQWNDFKEKNRISSIHEIHRLGGSETCSGVNKARADYFKQKIPTKLERLVG